MKKNKSLYFILFAILLGVVLGTLSGPERGLFGISFYSVFDLFGSLFLNALLLIVVPLIISSIISGINNFGSGSNFGKVGLRTFLLFVATNLSGIILGFAIINIFSESFAAAAKGLSAISSDISTAKASAASVGNVRNIFLSIVPKNIFDALSSSQMLGIIFFSIIFGIALTQIEGKTQETLKNFWKGLFECMIKITQMVMKLLPYGVFFLVAKDFAISGLASLKSYGFYLMIILGGFAVHFIFIIPAFLKFVGGINPLTHIKNMSKALITAFSTCSSTATLPVTIEELQEKSKVLPRIASLVAPLGCSINLSASAMYVVVTSSFISSVYGIELTLPMQFIIFLLSFMTTFGVASIPSGCLVTTMLVLKGIGVPAEGIGKVIAVDRIIDMFRTMANVFSISATTAIVDKLSKKDVKVK